jgi:hypothetical protein
MAKTKFGVADNVSTDSGFGVYEGPLPKPNVVYPVVQKTASMRLTGENSKNPGSPYINSVWEITEGECKGYSAFHRVVPGDAEIQKTRVAQYMQSVAGKNSADIVHEEIADGGKIKTIGGKKVEGVRAGMTFSRVRDTYGVPEGEEAPWKAEPQDLYPGWKPKSKVEEEDAEEDESDDIDDEIEDDEEDVEEPEDDGDDEDGETGSDEDDEAEDGDEEDELVDYDKAAKMSLVELKKLAKEYEYDDSDLEEYKGPKGKKALLAQLVEDEVVSDPASDDEPPF